MDKTVNREVLIRNKLGLHARAASLLVKLAAEYQCDISLERDGIKANAKSIVGILMLSAARGTRLRLVAVGDDAETAVVALVKLIEEDMFNED